MDNDTANTSSNDSSDGSISSSSSRRSSLYVEDNESDSSSTQTSKPDANKECKHKNGSSKCLNESQSVGKFDYDLVGCVKEAHAPLYGVAIHMPELIEPEVICFATAGTNRINFYEYNRFTEAISLINCYMDSDTTEVYYVCTWSTDPRTQDALIAFAGLKGVIKVLCPFKPENKRPFLFGHGSAVNDLRFHPKSKQILLSSSKDYTLRLWNLNTNVCIAILGGAEGHRDEVLSADFNFCGSMIMSCGIDHSLKMWNLKRDNIQKAFKDSDTFTSSTKSFKTEMVNFPDYATRDVHYNYIDCVRWYGDLVLSKSIENHIVLWKPGQLEEDIYSITRSNKNTSILCKLGIKNADIWFVRFCLDYSQKFVALGNQTGKVYIWDMNVTEPNQFSKTVLSHSKSKTTIRAIALSRNGRDLIAVNDEGQVFIWKKKKNNK